jgi:hypothetical protein
VIRLPRHGASCPIGLGVSCNADRNVKSKITRDGVFLGQVFLQYNDLGVLGADELDVQPEHVDVDGDDAREEHGEEDDPEHAPAEDVWLCPRARRGTDSTRTLSDRRHRSTFTAARRRACLTGRSTARVLC